MACGYKLEITDITRFILNYDSHQYFNKNKPTNELMNSEISRTQIGRRANEKTIVPFIK